jgi:hypothetical protein
MDAFAKNYHFEYMLFERKTFEGLYKVELVTLKIILGPKHDLRNGYVQTIVRHFLGTIALAARETPGAVRIVVTNEGGLKYGEDCFDLINPE